ncbi:hypothetical protein CMALT394_560004 [Carnobacterium maltaromaticum]|nr:hypothetical protein CMALT394_560004 [Carnobacterium maltaromaticum]
MNTVFLMLFLKTFITVFLMIKTSIFSLQFFYSYKPYLISQLNNNLPVSKSKLNNEKAPHD